jgi:hypothetical protein
LPRFGGGNYLPIPTPISSPAETLICECRQDPAARSFSDLDLLVPRRDIEAAIWRMAGMGFDPDIPVRLVRTDKILGQYLFRRIGTSRIVELHTELAFRHYPRPMRIEEMIGRKRQVLLDGREVPALSLYDEVMLDCVHGGKDFWERLMWVSDVAALLTRYPEIDWQQVRQVADEVGARRMLFVGLQLACATFGIAMPNSIAEAIQQDRATEALCAKIQRWLPYAGHSPQPVATRAIYRMNIAGGGISGLAYLLRLSLSPTEDDWQEGAEGRPSQFWHAVRRPLRLLRKYGSHE